jgi:hypothetical protein
MRWRSVAEWVGFQFVWFTCALGAAQGWSAPGIIAASLFIATVLAMKRRTLSECLTILACGAVGLVAESVLVSAGFVRFAASWPSSQLAPAWIVALWLAFGVTLPGLAALLGHRLFIKGSFSGLVAGPLAYWAGERLGALEIAAGAQLTYLAIGLIWAIALPFLLLLQQRLHPANR